MKHISRSGWVIFQTLYRQRRGHPSRQRNLVAYSSLRNLHNNKSIFGPYSLTQNLYPSNGSMIPPVNPAKPMDYFSANIRPRLSPLVLTQSMRHVSLRHLKALCGPPDMTQRSLASSVERPRAHIWSALVSEWAYQHRSIERRNSCTSVIDRFVSADLWVLGPRYPTTCMIHLTSVPYRRNRAATLTHPSASLWDSIFNMFCIALEKDCVAAKNVDVVVYRSITNIKE